MLLKRILVIGASDLFDLLQTSLRVDDYAILGYFSPTPMQTSAYADYRYLGPDSNILDDVYSAAAFVIAVYDNNRRRTMHDQLKAAGRERLTVIHPSSIIYPSAKIGVGCVIGPRAMISSHAVVGDGAYINYGSLIGHDVEVGDFSFVSPGAQLLGGARLGEGSLVGSNAVVLSHVSVGRNVSISAGAIISRDVPDDTTVMVEQKIRFIPKAP